MEPPARTFFLGNSCHVCKSEDTPHACQVCRMVFYCSPEHRRENWFEHSRICWAVNKICEAGKVSHLYELYDGQDFIQFRHGVASRCREFLGRNLKPWEFEMIYYTRVCDVCREYDWRKLESCAGCRFVYTCEKRHFREDHARWCKTLKTYVEVVVRQSGGNTQGVKIPEIKNGTCKSMSDVFSENVTPEGREPEVEQALASEVLTYPLTVLSALRLLDIHQKNHVRVLFVGAETQAEVEPLEKWEKFLLHALDDVENLSLKFLGPELRTSAGEITWDVCETCRARGKALKCEFMSGKFYHDYAGARPELICALNSGMYRDFGFGNENSWQETIVELFSRGDSPVLITEYTRRELFLVLEKIRKLCGEVARVVEPGPNPFAGLKPSLNIISWEESPVIFKNYFRVILRNRKADN